MKIKVKILIFIAILSCIFSGCGITNQPQVGDNSGEDQPLLPSRPNGNYQVEITVTDEALYEDYNSESLPEVIKRTSESVVQIQTDITSVGFYASGVVIAVSDDGRYSYIATCHQAIVGASVVDVNVVTEDGVKTYSASPMGTDPQTNLCVMRVEEKLTPAIFYSDSQQSLKAGEAIIAVSNPLTLAQTVASSGIIGSNRFSVLAEEGKSNEYMLTDAFVNANSAGGGIFTAKGGYLAGIIDSYTGMKNNWAGYIIPADVVQNVCTEIIKNGYVTGRYKLGIGVSDNLTAWGVTESIVVTSLSEDGSIFSSGAGLRVGDVITRISYAPTGDVYLNTAADFYEYLYEICDFKVGEKITFFIERNGTEDQITITIKQYNYFER